MLGGVVVVEIVVEIVAEIPVAPEAEQVTQNQGDRREADAHDDHDAEEVIDFVRRCVGVGRTQPEVRVQRPSSDLQNRA